MTPLTRQTILVTGATSGLGRALAGRLASLGATVVLHGRDPRKVAAARREIIEAHGGASVRSAVADLASLDEVDRLAETVLAEHPELHTLVNNAGIGFGSQNGQREVSRDGVELRFAVNYMAAYRLTQRLVPLLTASAPSRIVQVASAGQAPLDFDDPMLERAYDGVTAYRRSKLALVMTTLDLAGELAGQGVTVNALHPATFMDTGMVRDAGLHPASSLEEGLDATLRLVADPTLDGVTGRYYDGTRAARALDQAYDAGARAQLRALTNQLVEHAVSSRGAGGT